MGAIEDDMCEVSPCDSSKIMFELIPDLRAKTDRLFPMIALMID